MNSTDLYKLWLIVGLQNDQPQIDSSDSLATTVFILKREPPLKVDHLLSVSQLGSTRPGPLNNLNSRTVQNAVHIIHRVEKESFKEFITV